MSKRQSLFSRLHFADLHHSWSCVPALLLCDSDVGLDAAMRDQLAALLAG